MSVHRRLLDQSASYRENRNKLETFTIAFRENRGAREGITTIPVVFHVVYNGSEENVGEDQIRTQIEVLNRDFGRSNAEIASLPSAWAPLAGDTRIRFQLATVDPGGAPTGGIVRQPTSVAAFDENDAVKFGSRGGADAWPADRYLNIWVCKLASLLGYAQFPGGPAATDGVVIDYRSFGTTGAAEPPFDGGRTATHEIGHWLNLLHIWGDDGTGCAGTDLVEDTPNQAGPNTGRPTFPHVTCRNGPDGDMFVNFMDYTDDDVMAMFTAGQVTRMQATLDGVRSTFVTEQTPVTPAQPQVAWTHTDLSEATGAAPAVGDPVVVIVGDGSLRVLYRGLDEHIHEIAEGFVGGRTRSSDAERSDR